MDNREDSRLSARLILRRVGDRLAPRDDIQRELLQAVPADRDGEWIGRYSRHPNHHRLFFALLKLTLDNTDDFTSMDMLLTWLKVKLAYVDVLMTGEGKTVYLPKSISFASCDQVTFREFFDRSIDVIVQRYGFERPALLAEIESVTGLRWSEPA